MTPLAIVLTILLVGTLIAAGILFYKMSKKGWKCVEGKCEFVSGGDHDSKSECESEPGCQTEDKKYACSTATYQCVESEAGTSLEKCQAGCKAPEPEQTIQYVYPAYYPQSLYRRPYYWRPGGRHWRPRRRRHHLL